MRYPYAEKDAEKFLAYAKQCVSNSQNIILAIVLKENNKIIGGISIERINKKDDTADGEVWLNEAYWGVTAMAQKLFTFRLSVLLKS